MSRLWKVKWKMSRTIYSIQQLRFQYSISSLLEIPTYIGDISHYTIYHQFIIRASLRIRYTNYKVRLRKNINYRRHNNFLRNMGKITWIWEVEFLPHPHSDNPLRCLLNIHHREMKMYVSGFLIEQFTPMQISFERVETCVPTTLNSNRPRRVMNIIKATPVFQYD